MPDIGNLLGLAHQKVSDQELTKPTMFRLVSSIEGFSLSFDLERFVLWWSPNMRQSIYKCSWRIY